MGGSFVILLGFVCVCASVESAPGFNLLQPDSYNHPNSFANKEVPELSVVSRVLKEELASNSLYRYIWNRAKEEIRALKKITNRKKYFNKTTPLKCYIAIRAYTLDYEWYVNGTKRKLFRDFNDKYSNLTDEASWERFPYKSLYYLLNIAVPLIRNDPYPGQDSYRGLNNFHFDPVPKVGQLFYFDYFASFTTKFYVVIEDFFKANGTIIQLDGGASVAMGIEGYSRYDEFEVLVFPRNTFMVTDFIRGLGNDTLILEEVKTKF